MGYLIKLQNEDLYLTDVAGWGPTFGPKNKAKVFYVKMLAELYARDYLSSLKTTVVYGNKH